MQKASRDSRGGSERQSCAPRSKEAKVEGVSPPATTSQPASRAKTSAQACSFARRGCLARKKAAAAPLRPSSLGPWPGWVQELCRLRQLLLEPVQKRHIQLSEGLVLRGVSRNPRQDLG